MITMVEEAAGVTLAVLNGGAYDRGGGGGGGSYSILQNQNNRAVTTQEMAH